MAKSSAREKVIRAASMVVNTTGKYSGLQPAITAEIAAFSTVHGARSTGISPMIAVGSRRVPVRFTFIAVDTAG